jgi:predicted neutral ceramidase superfamily lipid hydrolase
MALTKEQLPRYEQVIGSAIRRYGWIIGFPSLWVLLALLLTSSLCSWLLAVTLFGSSPATIYWWIFSFALAPLILDNLFLWGKWYGSSILDRRRLAATSLVCNIAFLFCALTLGGLGVLLSQSPLSRVGIMLGMSLNFAIRLAALSVLGAPRLRLGATSLYFLVVFGTAVQGLPAMTNGYGWLLAVVGCWLISSLINSINLLAINSIGTKMVGASSFNLFHAYLESRLGGENRSFEGFLEKVGEERDIGCGLVLFRDERGEGLLGLGSISAHFGPFGRVGSSGLSHDLRLDLEKRLHSPVSVIREISDHTMDLVSEEECRELIAEFPTEPGIEGLARCSPLITETYHDHAASSLVADDFSLTVLSRAPIPTEDFPAMVGDLVRQSLVLHGIRESIVVDAHNCIGDLLSTPSSVVPDDFVEAANRSVNEAHRRLGPLEVGFCRINPPEVGLDAGLGPDGICAIVLKVEGEVSALLVLDGNNMLAGLREKIREELSGNSLSSRSEVITTDTHLVTGLSHVRGGYEPLGASISQQLLVGLCKEAVSRALLAARPARISIASGTVKGIRVVGSGFGRLAELLDSAVSAVKRRLSASLLICIILFYLIAILF